MGVHFFFLIPNTFAITAQTTFLVAFAVYVIMIAFQEQVILAPDSRLD